MLVARTNRERAERRQTAVRWPSAAHSFAACMLSHLGTAECAAMREMKVAERALTVTFGLHRT